MSLEIEELSAKLHSLYQKEAKRQGDVRHHDDYAALRENTKEFDRVLARYILDREAANRKENARLRRALEDISLYTTDYMEEEFIGVLEEIIEKATRAIE